MLKDKQNNSGFYIDQYVNVSVFGQWISQVFEHHVTLWLNRFSIRNNFDIFSKQSFLKYPIASDSVYLHNIWIVWRYSIAPLL